MRKVIRTGRIQKQKGCCDMTMEAKSALLAVRTAIVRFFGRRSTKSHIFAFVLGVLLGTVGMRVWTTPPSAQSVEPTPEITYVTPAPVVDSEYQTDYDAACVARVLYGIRGYDLSENAKTAVIEVILNRVECSFGEFGDTVQAVCEKPNQWQGFTTDSKYLKEDYELAVEVLNSENPVRTIPEGCYFLVVKQGAVVARTEWDGQGNEWVVK